MQIKLRFRISMHVVEVEERGNSLNGTKRKVIFLFTVYKELVVVTQLQFLRSLTSHLYKYLLLFSFTGIELILDTEIVNADLASKTLVSNNGQVPKFDSCNWFYCEYTFALCILPFMFLFSFSCLDLIS